MNEESTSKKTFAFLRVHKSLSDLKKGEYCLRKTANSFFHNLYFSCPNCGYLYYLTTVPQNIDDKDINEIFEKEKIKYECEDYIHALKVCIAENI